MASATMMIETEKHTLFEPNQSANAPADAAWIESQIRISESPSVAAYVVNHLHLADDPKFVRSESGLFDKLLNRIGWGPPAPQSDAERAAKATSLLMSQLRIHRVGPSYIIAIDFHSHDAEQATKVANTVIDGYIFDQLNAKYQANRRAGDWLQERLQALREQAASAERAVVDFKAKNNIVAASGTLINEKQLSEITSELATARAHASDVQARFNRIDAIQQAYRPDRSSGGADETISDALSNSIITSLRTKYLEYVRRESEYAAKYGKNHIATVNLRNMIDDIRRSIYDELGRIQESYRSEYQIAKQHQDEMEKALAGLISQTQETNQAQVTLFSLEAAAKSYRKLYDDFLQRHTEAVQQQSFPISYARPVAAASVSKTFPQPAMVWFAAVGVGGMLGVGLGLLREMMDGRFRTREQVRSVIDADCLAMIPKMDDPKKLFRSRQLRRYASIAMPTVDGVGVRTVRRAPEMLWPDDDSQSSPYADALRAIKLDLDHRANARSDEDHEKKARFINATGVIGLTSCLSGEGKSTTAAGMASLIARSGRRVVLVDADVRSRALSSALAPDASVGLLDVIAKRVPVADALWNDPGTNMAFIPTVTNPDLPNAADLLASEDARAFFRALRLKYEYVIVDLAPLISMVDIRATARLIDSYLLVIKWGETKIDAVRYALRHAPQVRQNIIGAVLNKVNMAALRHYDSYGANYYYGRYGAHSAN
jgi:succinoglycan biosynthesis transport protein ExoP